MPRRPKQGAPETIRQKLVALLSEFEQELKKHDLREKVQTLVPAFHLVRDLGVSLMPQEGPTAARDRILAYFRKYPLTTIHGDELMVVAGIQDYPRRIRELRREYGWAIASGVTVAEMVQVGDISAEQENICSLRPEEYALLYTKQDRDAAFRWRVANNIRKSSSSVQQKIIDFLRKNVGKPVTGEELRYVAKDKTEWARRVRELRTEHGWSIVTRNTGRPDLPVGTYVLEEDRQSPEHDRSISDPTRREVLVRDNYTCTSCGWTHEHWNPSDPRHLELHHVKHHARGGENTADNLVALCTVCHDKLHRKGRG